MRHYDGGSSEVAERTWESIKVDRKYVSTDKSRIYKQYDVGS